MNGRFRSPTLWLSVAAAVAGLLLLWNFWVQRRTALDLAALRTQVADLQAAANQPAVVLPAPGTVPAVVAEATPDYANSLAAITKRLDQLLSAAGRTESSQSQTEAIKVLAARFDELLLPAENWRKQFDALETELAENPPSDPAAARALRDRAAELARSLPPLAEVEALPRLNVVRWSALALAMLHPEEGETEDPLAAAEELRALAAARPTDAPRQLAEQLETRARALEELALGAARGAARLFLAGAESVDRLSTAEEHIAPFYELLNASDDAADRALCEKVREQMMLLEAHQQAAELAARWEKLEPLREEQPRLFETGVNLLLGELMTARVALAGAGLAHEGFARLEAELRREHGAISQRAEERHAAASRRYQQWALRQISEFEKRNYNARLDEITSRLASFKEAGEAVSWPLLAECPGMKRKLEEIAGGEIAETRITAEAQRKIYKECAGVTGGELTNSWNHDEDLAKLCVAQSAIDFLLPIDLRLLELPVQKRFDQAFGRSWELLEGTDGQVRIAQQSVVAAKRELREFLEN